MYCMHECLLSCVITWWHHSPIQSCDMNYLPNYLLTYEVTVHESVTVKAPAVLQDHHLFHSGWRGHHQLLLCFPADGWPS